MEIFSNWIFWVILASIVFVLALIGYLTESMKKSNKDDKKDTEAKDDNQVNVDATPAQEEPVVTETPADDWMTMPEVNKPLEEVKVDSIDDTPNESPLTADVNKEENTDMFTNSNVNETVMPVENNIANNVETESSVNQTETTEIPMTKAEETLVTPETTVSSDVTSSEPVQLTQTETANTSESDEKNTDIWNL